MKPPNTYAERQALENYRKSQIADAIAKRSRGRPPLPPDQRSTVLPDLRCPPGLSKDIAETAASLGIKVPAWRVQAYREKLEREAQTRKPLQG